MLEINVIYQLLLVFLGKLAYGGKQVEEPIPFLWTKNFWQFLDCRAHDPKLQVCHPAWPRVCKFEIAECFDSVETLLDSGPAARL